MIFDIRMRWAWLVCLAAPALYAQTYPTKPIRVLAPFTAGSTVDVMARVVQEQLAARLNQNLVIDNRPGANGIIATEMVAKARPDGYTMLISTGSFTGNVIATKNCHMTRCAILRRSRR